MANLNMLRKRKQDELENCMNTSNASEDIEGINKKLLSCLILLTKYIIDVQKSKSEPLRYDTQMVIKTENDSSCDIDITEHNIALQSEYSASYNNILSNNISLLKQHISELEAMYNMPNNSTLNDNFNNSNYTSIDSSHPTLVLHYLSDYSMSITEQVCNMINMYKSEQTSEYVKKIRKRLSKINKKIKSIPLQTNTIKNNFNNTNANESNNKENQYQVEVNQLSEKLAILIKQVSKVKKIYKKRVLNIYINKSVINIVNETRGNWEPPKKKQKKNLNNNELIVANGSDCINVEKHNIDVEKIASSGKKKHKKDKKSNQLNDENNGIINEGEYLSIDIPSQNIFKTPEKKRKSQKSLFKNAETKINRDNTASKVNSIDNVYGISDANLKVVITGKVNRKSKDKSDKDENFSEPELNSEYQQNEYINITKIAVDDENIENTKESKRKKKKSKNKNNLVNNQIEIFEKVNEKKKEIVQGVYKVLIKNKNEDTEFESPKTKLKQNKDNIEKKAVSNVYEKLTEIENNENEQVKLRKKTFKNKTNVEEITRESETTEMINNGQIPKKKHKNKKKDKSTKNVEEDMLNNISGGLNETGNNENGLKLLTHQSPKKKHKKKDKCNENWNQEATQIKKEVLDHRENNEESLKKKHKNKIKSNENSEKEMAQDVNKNDESIVDISKEQRENKETHKRNSKSFEVLQKTSSEKEKLLENEKMQSEKSKKKINCISLLENNIENLLDNHIKIFTADKAMIPDIKLEVCEDNSIMDEIMSDDMDLSLWCEIMQDDKERFLYLEERLEIVKEKLKINSETKNKLRGLSVLLDVDVPKSHTIENRLSYGPSRGQVELLKELGVKSGPITKDEDEIICSNWKSFCKNHDFPDDPTPFLMLQHGQEKLMPLNERKKFIQYLGRGLPHRALHTIYRRFKLLYSDMKTGRFNEEEDKLILAYVNRANNNAKFAALVPILNRSRTAIEARYRILKQGQTEKIYWSLELKAELIKHLMAVMNVENVLDLQQADIKHHHFMKVSNRMKLPTIKIRLQWCTKLYTQLFAPKPLYLDQIKIDITEKLYEMNVNDWRKIDWHEINKSFPGFSTNTLRAIMKTLARFNCPRNIYTNLQAVLVHLREVWIPQLRCRKAFNKNYICRLILEDNFTLREYE